MKKYDRVWGWLWFVLGLGICAESIRLNLGTLHKPGPGFLPFLTGAFLGTLGLILGLSSVSNEFKEEDSGNKTWIKGKEKNILLPLSALFGYILLLDFLGFLFTTFVFLFFLFKLAEPKRWFFPLYLAGGTAVLSYLIFSVWLQCQFPKGVFKF